MKKRIGVVFGGRSVEHEISVLSAMQAMDALDVTKYEVLPIYISQSGKWYCGSELRKREFYKDLPNNLKKVKEVQFVAEPGIGGLVHNKKGLFGSVTQEVVTVDVYVPVFHGQYGEDGCIQGLFELSNVVYSGPQVLASAIAMNKIACKDILSKYGIPVLPSNVAQKSEVQDDINSVISKIKQTAGLENYPLFVKPGNLGSSVGVSKANNDSELAAALAKVFQFDLEAIVEPCISKLMEINVSVIEKDSNVKSSKPDVSVVEIPVASGEFLSYEDKYLRDGGGKKGGSKNSTSQGMASLTRVINPDNLDPKYRDGVRQNAEKAYAILKCSGVVRFDFMVDLDSGNFYFNELNSIPGSLSFYLWDQSTPLLLLSDIMDRMIDGAISRYGLKNQLKRDFGFKALAA